MKKQRGLTVASTIAIQLTIGIAYIWSVFQTGVANSIFNGDNAAASLTFSLLLATLTIGSVIGGKLAVRFSTRIVVLIGGIILSTGFMLASFVTANFPWMLWISYGVMGGVGMGFTYSTTIACVQKWFPHRKGFITGVVVASLGFGGVVFTPIIERLITVFGGVGAGESSTFMVLSVLFLTVCTGGSFLLKNPPEDYMKDHVTATTSTAIKSSKDYSPLEMLKSPKFYLITLSLLLACMGGLMMMGFAKPFAIMKGLSSTATVGVLAITMFNSIGRMTWGVVSDKFGRVNTILVLLLASAVLSLMVSIADGYWVYILIAGIGFFYGGFLSTFPALTADLFGAKHMASNYGYVLLGFGTGAIISSQIVGYYVNIAAADISLLFPAFQIASICAATGIAMMLILKTMTRTGTKNKTETKTKQKEKQLKIQKSEARI